MPEARRLLATGETGATTAAFHMSALHPSQFSREYVRVAGASHSNPMQTVSAKFKSWQTAEMCERR